MVTKSTAGRTETMSRAWGVKKAFHPACPAAAQALGFIPPVSLWAKFEIHNLVDSFARLKGNKMPASQQSHGALIKLVRRPEHDFDLWSDSVRSSTSLRLVDQNVISPVAGAHLRLTLL